MAQSTYLDLKTRDGYRVQVLSPKTVDWQREMREWRIKAGSARLLKVSKTDVRKIYLYEQNKDGKETNVIAIDQHGNECERETTLVYSKSIYCGDIKSKNQAMSDKFWLKAARKVIDEGFAAEQKFEFRYQYLPEIQHAKCEMAHFYVENDNFKPTFWDVAPERHVQNVFYPDPTKKTANGGKNRSQRKMFVPSPSRYVPKVNNLETGSYNSDSGVSSGYLPKVQNNKAVRNVGTGYVAGRTQKVRDQQYNSGGDFFGPFIYKKDEVCDRV